jgi:hypothetical protein
MKALALAHGFTLRTQPDGSADLNPYVYTFAGALATAAREDERNRHEHLVYILHKASRFVLEEEITRQTSYEPGDEGYECVEEARALREEIETWLER